MRPLCRSLYALLGCLCVPALGAQTGPSGPCGPPPAMLQPNAQPNILTEQQEQWLGDAMADMVERENRPIKDPRQNSYLQAIGERLLAVLPPTSIKFRFLIVDSSDINGFSLAGGRVYVTRKLVANAQSEDELAGVLAHEMGHILTHQFAYEFTADLKRLLGVTSIGDRADVYARVQQLADAHMRDKHPHSIDDDGKQDQADRVAVYAMAAAGFRPQAYAEFWDRSFFVGGKTGSGLSDFFGLTKPDQKRLRLMQRMVADLPAGCGAPPADTVAAAAAFKKWHTEVIANQSTGAVAGSASTSEVALNPPLRLDLERVRFSRDGKYLLAQDESSISVAQREPLKVLFRFDAERALPAEFTPDSQGIVFHTAGLHVERWSVADQKLVEAHEVVVKQGCEQTVLSPDGRSLACISFNPSSNDIDLTLLDVETGKVAFQKKSWFSPSYYFVVSLMLHDRYGTAPELVPFSFSADGNLLLIGPGEQKLAFDLRDRAPIKLGSGMHVEVASIYAFRGNDQVLAVNPRFGSMSGFYSFPEGKRVQQVTLASASVASVTHGDLFLAPAPKDYAMGLVDLSQGKYIALSKLPALDAFDQDVLTEDGDGGVVIYKVPKTPSSHVARLPLPLSPLANAKGTALSPDGRYLALSTRHRSSVWDLSTGKQINAARGFTQAGFTADGRLLIEFPKLGTEHHISEIDFEGKGFVAFGYKLEDSEHLEASRLLQWKQDKKVYTFTARNPRDHTIQWTRSFTDDRPGYTINETDNDIVFSSLLPMASAREALRADPKLKAQASALKFKDNGRLVEIVDAETGKTRVAVVIEVPLSYAGADGYTRVGNQLYLSVGDNRTLVYTLSTGQQLRQIFGVVVAADPASERVAIINRRDELTVYDRAGVELQHLKLESPVRFATLLDKGNSLAALTADQKIRRFDIANALASSRTASSAATASAATASAATASAATASAATASGPVAAH